MPPPSENLATLPAADDDDDDDDEDGFLFWVDMVNLTGVVVLLFKRAWKGLL